VAFDGGHVGLIGADAIRRIAETGDRRATRIQAGRVQEWIDDPEVRALVQECLLIGGSHFHMWMPFT